MDSELFPVPPCRLCGWMRTIFFYGDKRRQYYKCPRCEIVFVPAAFILPDEAEKAEYDLHQNTEGDAGYEKFLSRAADPLIAYIHKQFPDNQKKKGIDFGCGPTPVLATMLSKQLTECDVGVYDKFYFPENEHLLSEEGTYNFVISTEVAEHLSDPLRVLKQLWKTLKYDGGVLVIMTKRVEGTVEKFCNWHYIRDPTHITFYHENSFRWLSTSLPRENERCDVRFPARDVVLLIKNVFPSS